MKLIDAFNVLRSMQGRKCESFRCFLAAGLNPLHLKTLLAAELGLALRDRRIEVEEGLYGDLSGNLIRLSEGDADSGIVLIEWPDLDPRLGVRSSARWSRLECADILLCAKRRALEIQTSIEKICWQMPVVLCCPTLPLLPLSFVPGWQAGAFDLELRGIVQSFSATVSHFHRVQVLSCQRIDLLSPLAERHDVQSEVLTGFPYSLPHASSLASLLAYLVRKPIPKKGLITDLDDTLWRGIVGEVGVDGVSWGLDKHSQMHAFYQRLLGALATEGVLIGVASKNELPLVEEALQREDLALSPRMLFPLEVTWKPKSHSVDRILKTWNVGPDSVVFIDDSPLELAEVKASHPEIECLLFPTKDSAGIYNLARTLRDLFGKTEILEEDSVRAESIRRSHTPNDVDGSTAAVSETGFLDQVEAEIQFNFGKKPLDPRALELVNKTNQFNLNGKRFTEVSWQNRLLDDNCFLLVASYKDKYGPLGKIAVIAGSQDGKKLIVATWVMSCRAFSRNIEYRCLQELLAKFDVDEIEFDYLSTNRNGPVRSFIRSLTGTDPIAGCNISRSSLEMRLESLRAPEEVTNG